MLAASAHGNERHFFLGQFAEGTLRMAIVRAHRCFRAVGAARAHATCLGQRGLLSRSLQAAWDGCTR